MLWVATNNDIDCGKYIRSIGNPKQKGDLILGNSDLDVVSLLQRIRELLRKIPFINRT